MKNIFPCAEHFIWIPTWLCTMPQSKTHTFSISNILIVQHLMNILEYNFRTTCVKPHLHSVSYLRPNSIFQFWWLDNVCGTTYITFQNLVILLPSSAPVVNWNWAELSLGVHFSSLLRGDNYKTLIFVILRWYSDFVLDY